MDLIVLIIILGGVVGFVTFIVLRSILSPKRVESLSMLIKQNKIPLAIKTAKRIIEREPRNPDAHFLLAQAYLAEDKPELALMELKTVNQIGQFGNYAREIPFRQKIAELYAKFNQPEEALKEYLILVKRQPENAEHYFRIGRLFEDRNKSDKAAGYYKKAIEVDEGHAEANFRLGHLLFRAKRFPDAKVLLERAARKGDGAEASYYLGRIYREQKEYQTAINVLEKAARSPELKVKALIERGVCFLNIGDNERATGELERAINLSEGESNEVLYGRYFLGAAFEQSRRMDDAIQQWERIYAVKPDFRDVAEKLSQYQELRSDDRVKDYMTVGTEEFTAVCQGVCAAMGLTVRDVKASGDICEIVAVEHQSKWRNARKLPRMIRFFRVTDVIDEATIRNLHEEMKKQNITRGLVVTSSSFSRLAQDFAETRPIDLVDGSKLAELLKKTHL